VSNGAPRSVLSESSRGHGACGRTDDCNVVRDVCVVSPASKRRRGRERDEPTPAVTAPARLARTVIDAIVEELVKVDALRQAFQPRLGQWNLAGRVGRVGVVPGSRGGRDAEQQ
jgi:hypothetical protein